MWLTRGSTARRPHVEQAEWQISPVVRYSIGLNRQIPGQSSAFRSGTCKCGGTSGISTVIIFILWRNKRRAGHCSPEKQRRSSCTVGYDVLKNGNRSGTVWDDLQILPIVTLSVSQKF